MELSILYRGPLASCDYDCGYCPFAKRRDSPETLRADRAALERFVAWVIAQSEDQINVLFTPWGEGLTRSWYQRALVELSRLDHVGEVAIQTNLSSRTAWTAGADLDSLALWCTYHPDQVSYERFLGRCHELRDSGVRFSTGIVGLPEHLDAARRLRADLPDDVYLWVNAAEGHTYTDEEAEPWAEIDPLFPVSRFPHASQGHACRAGESVISVDGDGEVYRCHFVSRTEPTERLGNLYDGSYRQALRARLCPLTQCDCHIGYVHMPELGLYDTFAGGVLARIPAGATVLRPEPVLKPVPLLKSAGAAGTRPR
ncbi:Radical SAM domain protein [Catenulispora acidiphila DSM 44928]|uniref:Radical SAM domain protein n=1 Tax=Catenulispora acidiphila (strain DSM 44928 / JCM 14897 / NBRC 102108 / NRRL B-24433 / ID139908) TaxID=479433 RepID=C7Q602_CATAD|nr:STM4011 family radical SAM protein [Catenulispora acidiphila]ACU70099.1 Radical SAM domain protein [Catenulispora acidiphila DSM 44928]